MDVWHALRKPCPHGVIYPEHVSWICPTGRVRSRLCLAIGYGVLFCVNVSDVLEKTSDE